jgi:hypothetical protein
VCLDPNDNLWKNATADTVKPFGICGVSDILTQVRDELSNEVESTRGVSDYADGLSVVVEGRLEKLADGVIAPMAFVMPSATNPKTHVQEWDGVNGNQLMGMYTINITQYHGADKRLPPSADNDRIKIDTPAYAKSVAS